MPKQEPTAAQRARQQAARERFWTKTQELRQAFAGVDPDEIESAITEAIAEVRRENRIRRR